MKWHLLGFGQEEEDEDGDIAIPTMRTAVGMTAANLGTVFKDIAEREQLTSNQCKGGLEGTPNQRPP